MPVKKPLTQFESSIIALYTLQFPMLGVVTVNHELYLYNTMDDTKERLLRLNIPKEAKFYCAFDPINNRLVFGTSHSKTLHLIDMDQKKIIRKFELDEQYPTALVFDPNGSYLICGTDQGRVLLWRSDSSTLIARMHSFPEYAAHSTIKPKVNFVSSIVFEKEWVATSGYGGSVVITDYIGQTKTKRLHAGYVKNDALLFYKESLIVGNQSGTLLKLDRHSKYPNQRVSTSLGPITHLLKTGTEPYILAASEQNRIILIDADEMKILNNSYIELENPITTLCKDDKGKIYVGTKKGELILFDLEPEDQLNTLITSKKYSEAYLYSQQEPLLQHRGAYQELESIFDIAMESARVALERGDPERANEILSPFNPAKSKETATLSIAFSHINRLTHLFNQKKFPPLYGLVMQYPPLRSTSLFLQVENFWAKQFSSAQKMMIMGKTKECKDEIQLFTGVSVKEPFIQLLLQHFDILIKCSKAISELNYQTLMMLGHRYPIIRKLPSYIQLVAEAGELIPAITDALKTKAFERANILLNELAEVTQYEEEFVRLKTFSSHASNLYHAISHEHWRSAYRLLDTHRDLMILPWAQELETQWYEKLLRCENYAIQGDASSVKKEFTNVISLPQRHERIGDLLRTAYQVQLKQILRKDQHRFKSGAETYCELFGIDTELRYLLKTAQAQGIEVVLQPMQLQSKSRDQWLSGITMLPNRIA
jgi:WD40 repeat protein